MRNESYYKKLGRVYDLCNSIEENRKEIIALAVKDLNFTTRDVSEEVDIVLRQLRMFAEAGPILEKRVPLGGANSSISLMLSYNGSSWLNVAIISIYMAGSRVNVRFSSRGKSLLELTEKMYRPIFGDQIRFCSESGKEFLEKSLDDPDIPAMVVFGFDENILPYQSECMRTGKKFIFEGPGQDPFIVFADADLDLALRDLMAAKFWFSGQTCMAPKRIFVQRQIYDQFIDTLTEKVRALVTGEPADLATDVSALASDLAVSRIAAQLDEARRRGAMVTVGGGIEGNLVHPAVVKNATDDMLGMREEVFGPVIFSSPFDTAAEVRERAASHKYGLRAAVFGGDEAAAVAGALKGADYCHPVADYTFGKFGTVALNTLRSVSWRGAFVTVPVGGYGYSGWIWQTVDGKFGIKQGAKLLSVETSAEGS